MQWFTREGRLIYGNLPTLELKRSDLAMPNINSDHLPGIQSMASGKRYDSKSALRAEYKALGMYETAGCNIQPEKPKTDRKVLETTVARAFEKLNQGYAPGK